MVEISKSGSGEGLGGVIPRGYSKLETDRQRLQPRGNSPTNAVRLRPTKLGHLFGSDRTRRGPRPPASWFVWKPKSSTARSSPADARGGRVDQQTTALALPHDPDRSATDHHALRPERTLAGINACFHFIVVAIDRSSHELHHPFPHRPHEVPYAAELSHREPCSRRRGCDGSGLGLEPLLGISRRYAAASHRSPVSLPGWCWVPWPWRCSIYPSGSRRPCNSTSARTAPAGSPLTHGSARTAAPSCRPDGARRPRFGGDGGAHSASGQAVLTGTTSELPTPCLALHGGSHDARRLHCHPVGRRR